MRRHSLGLFAGAAFSMFGLPMTIFAHNAWSLALAYLGVVVMFVAAFVCAIRSAASPRSAAAWLLAEISLCGVLVRLFFWLWMSDQGG